MLHRSCFIFRIKSKSLPNNCVVGIWLDHLSSLNHYSLKSPILLAPLHRAPCIQIHKSCWFLLLSIFSLVTPFFSSVKSCFKSNLLEAQSLTFCPKAPFPRATALHLSPCFLHTNLMVTLMLNIGFFLSLSLHYNVRSKRSKTSYSILNPHDPE